MKNKKRKGYNTGGAVKNEQALSAVSNVASMFGPYGAAIGGAINIMGNMAIDPSNYIPVKQNTGSGYNKGGDIALNSQGIEVMGASGIDNNPRMIAGQDVNLTKGETVQATNSGAFVYSDDIIDPDSGKSFAKAASRYQKAIGKAEKDLEKNPSDKIASSTIKESQRILDQLATKQQELNGNHGDANNFNSGGPIGIAGLQNLVPYLRNTNQVNQLPTKTFTPVSNTTQAYQMPQVTPTYLGADPTKVKQPNMQTLGDKVKLGTSAVELIGRGIQAFDRPQVYRNDRYNADRQIFNPTKALQANNRNFRATTYGINSGNANSDRIFKTNAYVSKLKADGNTIRDYDQMQRQSDQQVNQYNQQSKARVDDINDRNRGVRDNEVSKFLTTVGNIGTQFQTANNAAVGNRMTMATLNSLSSQYGIPMEKLMGLINNTEDPSKGSVKFKQS